MIDDFNFAQTPNIIFGWEKSKSIGDILKQKQTKSVLVITGSKGLERYVDVEESLQELSSNITFSYAKIEKEPSPELIDAICGQHKENLPEMVVAIGGGSVLDAGKAISAMLTKDDSILNYLEGVGTKVHDGNKVPFIAMPTTSGTGSETTKNAVLSDVGENGFKKSLRHDNFIPDIALVDPKLTVSLPKETTANCGMDCFSQLLESYLSTKANIFTDSLALPALRQVVKYLPQSVANPDNKEARTAMSYGAMISGITLANAGLGVVHGFASAIGGFFEIPHGLVCGTLMPEANKAIYFKLIKKNPKHIAIAKLASLGRLLTNEIKKSDSYYASLFCNTIEDWKDEFNIKGLSNFGIKPIDFYKIIDATGVKNNPVKHSPEELYEILEQSY